MAKKKEKSTAYLAYIAMGFLLVSLLSVFASVWTYEELHPTLCYKWFATCGICFVVGMFLGKVVQEADKKEQSHGG